MIFAFCTVSYSFNIAARHHPYHYLGALSDPVPDQCKDDAPSFIKSEAAQFLLIPSSWQQNLKYLPFSKA